MFLEVKKREVLRLRNEFFFLLEASGILEFRNAIRSSFQALLTFEYNGWIKEGALSAAAETERDCFCLRGARAGPRMRAAAAAATDLVNAADDARAVCIVSKVRITAIIKSGALSLVCCP